MFDASPPSMPPLGGTKRVLLLGATGTIGLATARALAAKGHDVVALVREKTSPGHQGLLDELSALPNVSLVFGDVTAIDADAKNQLNPGEVDAVISCLSSRTGEPKDAWAIDYRAHSDLLRCCQHHQIGHFVLLSAICVQRPRLAFQHAKLAFERELKESGLRYSIVRPTAYFKSVSGQIDRLRKGKPFLLFGNGELTACKPISDRDLAAFLVGCLSNPIMINRTLPLGGPGPAMTPKEQGQALFEILGKPSKFKSVPPGLFLRLAGILQALGNVFAPLRQRAEFLRIAHYYATESMLFFDEETGGYSDEQTPSIGQDRLIDHYTDLVRNRDSADLKEHAMF